MRAAGYVQGISSEQHSLVIHRFPEGFVFEDPGYFTDPFRYVPHPLVRLAASEVIARIDADPELRAAFSEGKMLGVLVCEDCRGGCCNDSSPSRNKGECSARLPLQKPRGEICYIAAFSGNVNGRGCIEGFVPPIYDLTVPDGYFREREAEISEINRQIEELMDSDRKMCLEKELADAVRMRDMELDAMKESMADAKRRRAEVRAQCSDPEILDGLIRESQHEKAELRRLKQALEVAVKGISERIEQFNSRIESLKKQRASMSEELQDWIFRQYIVHNYHGEESSIADIFAASALVPPGGTGECAAPKLLEYAFRSGLRPLAMGEFWYGKSPDSAVRSHGRFYPSCTSKCGPLLTFMLEGLNLTSDFHTVRVREEAKPIIVYEDEAILVVEKPSGMPSVPGLDGRTSILELLSVTSNERNSFVTSSERSESRHLHPVHRLDMDTSGIMVFAKTPEAAVNLRKQFEEHSVRKTYMARVCSEGNSGGGTLWPVLPPWPQGEGPSDSWEGLSSGCPLRNFRTANAHGRIDLPLSADYDERPRQKVDFQQGKAAHTEYKVFSENPDGTADLLLYPLTGRTHQLRVHCAHHLGLGRPISGDLLYGAHCVNEDAHKTTDHPKDTPPDQKPSRLCLHALSIAFRHPVTSEPLTFTSDQLCY